MDSDDSTLGFDLRTLVIIGLAVLAEAAVWSLIEDAPLAVKIV